MAKYAELIDDFELEKRIRTIPDDYKEDPLPRLNREYY
jgi:hypothetical protein